MDRCKSWAPHAISRSNPGGNAGESWTQTREIVALFLLFFSFLFIYLFILCAVCVCLIFSSAEGPKKKGRRGWAPPTHPLTPDTGASLDTSGHVWGGIELICKSRLIKRRSIDAILLFAMLPRFWPSRFLT